MRLSLLRVPLLPSLSLISELVPLLLLLPLDSPSPNSNLVLPLLLGVMELLNSPSLLSTGTPLLREPRSNLPPTLMTKKLSLVVVEAVEEVLVAPEVDVVVVVVAAENSSNPMTMTYSAMIPMSTKTGIAEILMMTKWITTMVMMVMTPNTPLFA